MKSIELIGSADKCCGCGACYVSCPQYAITMKESQEGFLYPVINESLCIDCKRCLKVCKFKAPQLNTGEKQTYAAHAIDTDMRKVASGGIFSSLAQSVLDAQGIVYGCAMFHDDGQLVAKHICVTQKEELDKLKGSKYVQSNAADVYCDVKDNLLKQKVVLFSGTPCQIAGLKGYLQREYPTLYTVEVVCHGVPSLKLFQSYIGYIEGIEKIRIIDFKFRDKTQGWKLYGKMVLKNTNGDITEKYFETEESSYYQMFLNSYTYRDSCYKCPFASENRQADITIGDYWCIELVHPELFTDNGGSLNMSDGVSCIVVNNKQGNNLLKKHGQGVLKWESTYAKASKYNAQLIRSSMLKPERKKVFELYEQGYDKIEKWYQKRLAKIKLERKIRKMIPKSLKRVVRKIIK